MNLLCQDQFITNQEVVEWKSRLDFTTRYSWICHGFHIEELLSFISPLHNVIGPPLPKTK